MKGVIEASIYLVLFSLISFISIDFIRINKDATDALEMGQYVENYIEAYCSGLTVDEIDNRMKSIKKQVGNNGMKLDFLEKYKAGDYTYVDYELTYDLKAAMFGYKSKHTYRGIARYAEVV